MFRRRRHRLFLKKKKTERIKKENFVMGGV
jgi:hypothetical protein